MPNNRLTPNWENKPGTATNCQNSLGEPRSSVIVDILNHMVEASGSSWYKPILQ